MFFKIAEGYGDHTQNLAPFDASNIMFLDNKAVQLNSQETTLHHIPTRVALRVRSLYFPDPEGNLLEFVAYDENVR